MALLPRIIPPKPPLHFLPSFLRLFRADTVADPNSIPIVGEICNAFRRGWNWDTLSEKFDSLVLNRSIVEGVLLEFKNPGDARFGLGFFHWAAKTKRFDHGVETYCVMIHILVVAEKIRDAKALLESILKKVDDKSDSPKLIVVASLLSSYGPMCSRPLVFDLLIQSYAKLRMSETAFHVSCYLEEHGFPPSLATFNKLLHVTQKSDKNHYHCLVWRIYEHMIGKRTYPNDATIRILINALSKEGQLQKALNLMERIQAKRSPSVVVNTHLVYRVLEEGRIGEAMTLLKRMLQRNMVFDTIACSLTVYAKVKSGDVESAQQVYEEMMKRGFRENAFVYTSFIGAHCKNGRIEEAGCLMREMEDSGLNPYDETYNYLIDGLAKTGRVEESLDCCTRMMNKGILPTCSVFNLVVEKLCEIGDVKKGNDLFTALLEKGFMPNESTYSLLVSGYAKIGEGDEVLKLYYEIVYKKQLKGLLVSRSLIKSLCQCGKLSEAERYLRTVIDDGGEDEALYEVLIQSYLKEGNRAKGVKLYKEMISKGLKL